MTADQYTMYIATNAIAPAKNSNKYNAVLLGITGHPLNLASHIFYERLSCCQVADVVKLKLIMKRFGVSVDNA